MKKEEVKICNLCKLGIDETKEFARFTHFKNKKEILSEAYHHINCFRDRMLGTKELQKFAKQQAGIPEVII